MNESSSNKHLAVTSLLYTADVLERSSIFQIYLFIEPGKIEVVVT
jgi:hypothetical protein